LTTLKWEKCFRERGSEGLKGVVGIMEDVVEEFGGELGEIIAI